MEFLLKLNKKGVTIILITHDMHLMLEYTDKAIVISNGRKIADTTSAEILTDKEVIEKASLKETSLYDLALKFKLEDPKDFVCKFIDFDRGGKKLVDAMLTYIKKDSPIDKLTGATKLICFIFWTLEFKEVFL